MGSTSGAILSSGSCFLFDVVDVVLLVSSSFTSFMTLPFYTIPSPVLNMYKCPWHTLYKGLPWYTWTIHLQGLHLVFFLSFFFLHTKSRLVVSTAWTFTMEFDGSLKALWIMDVGRNNRLLGDGSVIVPWLWGSHQKVNVLSVFVHFSPSFLPSFKPSSPPSKKKLKQKPPLLLRSIPHFPLKLSLQTDWFN